VVAPTFDPAKRTLFGGQQGTLTNGNRTYNGYDFGSSVQYQCLSTATLARRVGYVELTVDTGSGTGFPNLGIVDSSWDVNVLGSIGKKSSATPNIGLLTDAGGGVSVVYINGSLFAVPSAIAGQGHTVGMIVHDSGKVWFIFDTGAIYPDTPTFDGSGNVTSGSGYTAAGMGSSISFGISTNRADGGTINAGQATAALAAYLPANVTIGWDAAAPNSYTLTATVSAVALSGQSATLRRALRLPITVKSLSATGQTAALSRSRLFTAAAGSAVLSGQSIGLRRAMHLPAAVTSLAVSGQTAGLKASRTLSATTATFALTGRAAVFGNAKTITASVGAFTFSGQAATVRSARTVTAGVRTFSIAGQVIAFGGARTLTASTASIALTGQTAALREAHRLAATLGQLALTGQTATFPRGARISIQTASFSVSPSPVTLRRTRRLAGDAGSFAATWFDAALTYSNAPIVRPPPSRIAASARLSRRVARSRHQRTASWH
jgi:hypothetical protein